MMKTKTFFLTAALVLATALTGAMMTSCSKNDIPVADNDGNPPLPKGRTVDLSELSADYVAVGGDTLTGTLDGSKQPYKISIAEGATVTLSDAIIKRDSKNHSWAGITCLGDATIILDGENSVEGFYRDYPGIQPGPEGTTLTIEGEGKLTASSLGAAGIGSGNGSYGTNVCGNITITGGIVTATGGVNGAGIGSGEGFRGTCVCGNITITGGIVTATGEDSGAGIGSGFCGTCGNITITGGTVVAKGEGFGTGIGCGGGDPEYPSVCGDITIECGEGFVSVTAIRGGEAYNPIGLSSYYEGRSICGKIMFGKTMIDYYFLSEGNYDGLIFTMSSSDPDDPEKGDIWTLTRQ